MAMKRQNTIKKLNKWDDFKKIRLDVIDKYIRQRKLQSKSEDWVRL